MDIRSKVIEIIADQAIIETSDVSDESTLEGLGIDSLGLVESIFAIEEAFDIQVPFKQINRMKVRLICHLLRQSYRELKS